MILDKAQRRKATKRRYYLKHRDQIRAARNTEHGKMLRKQYARRRKHIISAYNKKYHIKRRATNPSYGISLVLRASLRRGLIRQNAPKHKGALKLLGCSVSDFRIYLETKFEVGMNWGNYGKHGWHIDHIVPCALFDLTRPEHQKRCFHFSNMQPLWAEDNLRKHAKLFCNSKEFLAI